MRANARARTKTPNPAIDEIDTTARAAIWNGGRAGVCVCGRAKDLISDNFLVCQSGGLWCVAWRCAALRCVPDARNWAHDVGQQTEQRHRANICGPPRVEHIFIAQFVRAVAVAAVFFVSVCQFLNFGGPRDRRISNEPPKHARQTGNQFERNGRRKPHTAPPL